MKRILASLLLLIVSSFALDINSASAKDFEKIKGIGKKKAERIISYRDEHGKFSNVNDLKNVKGIGKKIIDIIKSDS